MKNILYQLSLLVMFMSYLMLAYLGVLLFWPITSFKVIDSKTPTDKKEYRSTEILILNVNSCRYNDNRGDVERVIRNLDNKLIAYSVAPVPLIAKPETCSERRVSVPLPAGMIPGRYNIETTIHIYSNILRTEVYTAESLPFNIIK